MTNKPGRASRATTYMMRVCSLACAVLGGTWCFGLAIIMWAHPDIFTTQPWFQFFQGVIIVGIALYCFFIASHRIVVVLLVPLSIFLAAQNIWDPFIRASRVFTAWEFFGVLMAMIGILLLVGVGFSVLHVIFIGVRRLKEKRGRDDYNWFAGQFVDMGVAFVDHVKKYKKVHLVFALVFLGSGVLVNATYLNWFIPANATVTLHPANYQVKFQFYGPSAHSYYTPEEITSLNNSGVRIVDCPAMFITYDEYKADPAFWWLNLTTYEQSSQYLATKAAIISTYSWWKQNASRVTFMYQIYGVPGGMVTDYAVAAGDWGVGAFLLDVWLTMQVVVGANLTNVVGFHTDQEDNVNGVPPLSETTGYPPVTATRDYGRNIEARQDYLDFFQMVKTTVETNATWKLFMQNMNKTHQIDHFMFSTTYGSEIVNGLSYDNTWDMDVFDRNVVNSIPYDEYLPMLYNQQYFPPDSANYGLYVQMKTLQCTLEKAGYPTHIGVLLGCMAKLDSMFIANYTGMQWNGAGEQSVDGFEVVARQVMVAKSFNCTWISFFPLNPYADQGFVGIFNSFGPTFFDKLNATVNGANSSAPFTIRNLPDAKQMQVDIARTLFLSSGWDWYYLVAFVAFFAVPWLLNVIKSRKLVQSENIQHMGREIKYNGTKIREV
ncbi:MAG TPA: hypothetical protein VKM55_01910 [Candidatus Lokiarchaeia archaeon]|nr:hypothetical protein [Candidatus Lokiarchaeia archaeon]